MKEEGSLYTPMGDSAMMLRQRKRNASPCNPRQKLPPMQGYELNPGLGRSAERPWLPTPLGGNPMANDCIEQEVEHDTGDWLRMQHSTVEILSLPFKKVNKTF